MLLPPCAVDVPPVSFEDGDEAWRILAEIYGGAGRLVTAKKDKVTIMGSMPKPDSKLPGHVRQRVTWLLELDLNMKDLSDLAAESEDCYCEIFNDSTIKMIKAFFPIGIHTKMSSFQGTAKERFGQISAHVECLIKQARGLLADVDGDGDTEASGGGRGGGYGDGINDFKKYVAPQLPAPIMTKEELDFAKIMTASEVPGLLPPEDMEGFDDEAAEKPKETVESEKSKATNFNILCDDCGSDAAEEAAGVGRRKR